MSSFMLQSIKNQYKEKNPKSIEQFWRKSGFKKLASTKTNKQKTDTICEVQFFETINFAFM